VTSAHSKIWAIGVVASLAAAYGAWLFADGFLAPAGCCGATWPLPDPMQAERLVQQHDPQQRDGAAQRTAALLITRSRPGDIEGWLRLAYADRLLHGRLTAEGGDALDLSYSLTPYAGPRAVWRIVFVLDNWDQAPDRVKRDALAEIGIIKTSEGERWRLEQLTPSIRDPAGRAVAALFGVLPLPGVHIE
jgi:hypothetical protein